MFVGGIGNVTSCNYLYIFLNDEGKEDRIKANTEKLRAIWDVANESIRFYDRMWNEVKEEYERKKAVVEEKYKYISKEDIEAAYKADRSSAWLLELQAPSNNEEYLRKHSEVFGLFDACRLASERGDEARRLKSQAQRGMDEQGVKQYKDLY